MASCGTIFAAMWPSDGLKLWFLKWLTQGLERKKVRKEERKKERKLISTIPVGERRAEKAILFS